jgi:pyroglutamyl-peptidase
MTQRLALVTGFRPYGGRGRNPAGEIAQALDGREIGGARVVGRQLPVSLANITAGAKDLLQELRPSVVVSVGLWPGEPLVRIERVGINVADFEIPDNDGHKPCDEPLVAAGRVAKFATLPVRKIEAAMLAAGIPARISNSAGTFLCNGCLYSFLSAAESVDPSITCGFVHVPYLPEQVAELLRKLKEDTRLEVHQRADMASMALATSTSAIEIAVAVAIAERWR